MSVKKVSGDFVFRIEELPDKYRLHNVQYRDGVYVVDWTKNFLRDGERHSQDDWIELTKNEEITLPDAPLIYSSMNAVANHTKQRELTEKVKQYFKEKLNVNPERPHTSSRAIYNPTGKDSIIHRVGYKDQYTSQTLNLVGNDCWITKYCSLEKEMKAILNCEDCQKIEKTTTKITGFKPYLYRINTKPTTKKELAVVLGVVNGGGWFGINVDSSIDGDRPALGVGSRSRRAKKNSTPQKDKEEKQLLEKTIITAEGVFSVIDKYIPNACQQQCRTDLQNYLEQKR